MGKNPQYHPKLLGEKLGKIRVQMFGNISYEAMIERLDVSDIPLRKNAILYYESGERLPALKVLLHYSKLSGISVNDLIDDDVSVDSLFRS
jgi:hypothetical protein